jgi:sporulation protein YabP
MEELNRTTGSIHRVAMLNRRNCTVSGVNDVLSFDEHEIVLETSQGMLMIKGEELHASRLTLDQGDVDLEGKIDSLHYAEPTDSAGRQESLLSRLFR